MENESKMEPLASELYNDLKKSNAFKEKLIWTLIVMICLLIAGLVGQHLYHIHQWSQFDTVVVDSGDGYGHANYVQGDNTGGIYNGEDRSPETP